MSDKLGFHDLLRLIIYLLSIGLIYLVLEAEIPPFKSWQYFLANRIALPPIATVFTAVILVSLLYLAIEILEPSDIKDDENIFVRFLWGMSHTFGLLNTKLLSATMLGTSIVFSTVGLLILFALSSVYSLSCNDNLIVFEVLTSKDPQSVPLLSESKYNAEPGTPILIKAVEHRTDLETQDTLACQWSYAGDGRIIDEAGCSLQIKLGLDEIEDVITAKVSQRNCSQNTLAVLFIHPIKLEEGP